MPTFTTESGEKCILNDTDLIGEGGEAWVYKGVLGGKPRACKIYKGPDAADYAGDTPQDKLNREGAKRRLESYAAKLREFPKGLPDNVGTPLGLLFSNKKFRGFYTGLIPEPRETLFRLSEADFRLAGVDTNTILAMLIKLHHTVVQSHKAGLIFGDFNDRNVLGFLPYVIDAESGSYGKYVCTTYTQKFVDPLLCDSKATSMQLVQPHNASSDIYAYTMMVFQLLLLVSPYDGKYKPQSKADWCPHDARPLHRKTILNKETVYPKWAVKLGYTPDILPDDLMQHFVRVLHEDFRGEFPIDILRAMRWTKCIKCGVQHARHACPNCATVEPRVVTKTGVVTSEVIFKTTGIILAADYQNGKMRYVYHDGVAIKREDGRVLIEGPLDPRLRIRINGDYTCVAKGDTLITFKTDRSQERLVVDKYGSLPMFDANAVRRYWINSGRLLTHDDVSGVAKERFIGNVLTNQTLFWCGDTFGFGFYRASQLNEFFVFDTHAMSLRDGLQIPPIKGRLLDAVCEFSTSWCWFMTSFEVNGVTTNRCVVLDKHGTVLGMVENEPWLESLRGKVAMGNYLFAATDEGIVRVECNNGTVSVTRTFPDTEPYVDENCQLFSGNKCLHVVTSNEIRSLTMA